MEGVFLGKEESLLKNDTFTDICRYAIEFTLCSFCGWVYEVLLNFIIYQHYTDRGVLHLPLCPIYGFAGLMLLLLFRRHGTWWGIFLGSAAIPTILELITYEPLRRIMGYSLWNYGAWWCNFRGIISLPSSLLFGFMGLLLLKGIHPLMDTIRQKSPAWVMQGMGVLCMIGIAGDAVIIFLL